MTLKEVIDKYPDYFPEQSCGFGCGDGWAHLINKICKVVLNQQNTWLKKKIDRWEKSDKPFFKFRFEQIKEKFGVLRVYWSASMIEHDWEKFDKTEYESKCNEIEDFLAGYIAAMEDFSTEICEDTGEKGKIRTSKPWMRTLSDARAKELGYTD